MSDESLKVITKPPIGGLKKGIAANRQAFDNNLRSIDPTTVPNRLGLVIDDSSSMGEEGMSNAHKAVKSFTDNCNMKDTSIAVYPLNREPKPLTCDYDLLNMYVLGLKATGGTYLYTTLKKMIEQSITRAIVFSDGGPTDSCLVRDPDSYNYMKDDTLALSIVKEYKEKEIQIDCIFIGLEDSNGYKELQELSKQTNGTFVHFKDTSSLAKSLKYLAPKYVALLANPEIKARIERGEAI